MARKIPEGEFRNKERTKSKLINTVGEIIRTQGYTKLGVNNIANCAGVSKKLIYRYFGNVENLIEIYVKKRDYWTPYHNEVKGLIEQYQGSELFTGIFEGLFTYFLENEEAQKIILWEISENSNIMRDIAAARERFGSGIFEEFDSLFKRAEVDIRGISALVLGGIYYMVLHSNAVGGTFCEIDIKTDEGRQCVLKTINDVFRLAFAESGKPFGSNYPTI